MRRPAARSRRCASAAAHRDRVRVPGVVDQEPAARQLALLRAPARERHLDDAVRQRHAERLAHGERRGRVRAPGGARRTRRRSRGRRSARARARRAPRRPAARTAGRRRPPARTARARARPRARPRRRRAAAPRAAPPSPARSFSMLPSSSRCTGAIAVIDADVAAARSRRAPRIWPAPRIPISVTTTSVSGSMRQSVSGSADLVVEAVLGRDEPRRAAAAARRGCPSSRSSRPSR